MVIKYFADIRVLAHCEEQQWTPPVGDLRELLAELAKRHGPAFESRVIPGGRVGEAIIILVNGMNIRHLRGLDTRLSQDATVAIFPMVAGG